MSAPQYPSHVPCPECGEYKKPIGANMCWDCKDKEMADLLRRRTEEGTVAEELGQKTSAE